MPKLLRKALTFLHHRSLLVGLLVFWSGVSWGQTNTWNGSSSTSWNTATNWSLNLVPTAAHDVVFETNANVLVNVTSTINSLTIRNNATVTLTSSGGGRIITIDNTNSTIELGSTLRIAGSTGSGTRSMAILFTGTARTMAIAGTLDLTGIGEGSIYNATNSLTTVTGTIRKANGGGNTGVTTSTAANLSFLASSIYSHEVNGNSITTASWASTSTVTISGTTTIDPTVLNQSFGNFIWNATGLGTNSVNFNPIGIAGNLEINNGTATGLIIQTVTPISIGENLIIAGGQYVVGSMSSRTMNVAGNVSITGGTLNLSRSNGIIGTLNLIGNFSHTAGTITETATGSGSINFNGSGTPQIFTSGGTVSNNINWTVNSGAFLQMAAEGTTVSGGGTFNLASGGTLGITSAAGITSTGTTGNIRVTGNRTYDTAANYIYNGNTNQALGNGIPATLNNLIIANTGASGGNTVTLDANRSITSNLSVNSGVFNLGSFTVNRGTVGGTLTLAANTTLLVGGGSNFPVNYATNSIDCSSTVNYNLSGNQTIGAVNYGNLILSGSGTKTLQTGTTQICTDLTLSGTAQTTGVVGLAIGGNVNIGTGTTFIAGNFTHTIEGNWTRAGTFTPGTSTINFTGANPGTIQSSIFNNLTFSGAGAKTSSGNLTINGNLLISNNYNAGNGIHSVAGNWTTNGIFTPGTSTINLNGTAAQTISGTSATPFASLTTSNILSVVVSNPISIAITLNLSNGAFNTNGNLTMGDASQILLTNVLADMNGAIQGIGDYDVIYSDGNRPTGSELSGAELRNVTLTSTSGSTLTASSNFTMKGQLNIPTGVTLQMGAFAIGPRLITTIGGGQLLTQSTALESLPSNVAWSFPVRFNRLTGGQTVPYGIYQILEILSTSGTTTMAAEGLGDFMIGNQLTITNPATVDASLSRVNFNALASQSIPGLAFRKLILSGSGNKTFATGTTMEKELVIFPSVIALLGNTNRSVETLILHGVSQAVGSFGSTVSAATNKLATYFGTAGTGILFVTNICQDGKWSGDVSSDWFLPGNWCSGSVPIATTDVIIPATVNLPVINTTGAVVRTITIESGASLTMTGTSGLSVRGNWVNNGTFSPGSGTITFQGTTAQTISGTSSTNFANLVISNTSGGITLGSTVSVNGVLSLTQGILTAGTNLSMNVGSEILRTAGSLTGTLQGTNSFDVSYTLTSKTSGPELANTGLRNLTVNLTAGQTLTLGTAPALPDGNVSLIGGRLNIAANNLDRSAAGGTITIGAGTTFITARGSADAFPITYTSRIIDATSTVEYIGTNQTVTANTYGNVILGGASGLKTFAGATTIAGNLSILTTTSANLGSASSTTNTLTLGVSGQPNGSYGSTVSTALYKNATYFGTTASGILNVTASTLICVNGYWIGGTSSDWFTTSNWCNGIVPTSTTDVLIPAVAPFQPVINAAGAVIRNLTIESGATLGMTGTQALTVTGNWVNNGTFNAGNSTIGFTGTAAQTFSGSGSNTLFNATLNNSAGLSISSAASVAGTLTLSSGILSSASNLTMNTNSEIVRSNGALTGNIQGTNLYNLTYQGTSKTTGGEVSGSNLNNVSVTLNSGQILSAGSSFTVRGILNIPVTINLNMVAFQLSGNTLTTSGSGTLTTQNTSTTPLPLNRTWSFLVLFNNLSGGQRAVSGVYQNLTVQLNSGTTTLSPDSDGPIEIASGNFTRTGTGGTLSAGTSLVIFSGPGAQSLPAITFNNLELKGGGDKSFTGSQNIGGNLTINGTAVARLGGSNRTAQTLTLGVVGQPVGSFGSTASPATFKRPLFFGTADLGILNVTTSTAICVDGTWQGTVSSNWFTAANWCDNVIPTLTIDVFVPSTAPFQPVISGSGAVTQNLVIESGASLEITGAFTLTIGGNWENSGTFIPGTNSKVDFSGDEPGVIGAGNFATVSFTGTGPKTINATLNVSGDILPISTDVTLSDPFTLTLQAGKKMQIEVIGQLSTSGDSKIILLAESNYINLSTSEPSLEIKQTFSGTKGWRMIGTPLTTTYSSFTAGFETQGFPGSTNPSLQPNLLWWDETNQGTSLQAWRQPTNLAATAPAGRGHYFYVFNGDSKPAPTTGNYSDVLPITMSVTGSEVNLASGIFTFPVTYTAKDSNLVAQADTLIEVNQADEGFNLVANPTASTIDFHSASGWTKTNIDETIYVWDPASESFLTWNGLIGSLGSGRIAPFQAFWVKANAASPALQISNNNVKSLMSTDFFGRKLNVSPFKIDLHVTGEGLEAKSFISFDQDGKEGADPKDAYQLESLAQDWLLLYTYSSIKTKSPLVINHLPNLGSEEKVIPLHLAASKNGKAISGSYLMDWKLPAEWPGDVEIVLMDHLQKKAIDMKKESMHSFSYQAPEIPSASARKSQGEFTAPKAVLFQSPFETGEVNARSTNSTKLQRPFTIYIGSFPQDRIEYLPDFPKLFGPVPNPFTDQTKISFYLPSAEKAEILVYDMLGKSVGNFPATEYQEGIHELVWTPSAMNLPNGMYMIRLITKTHSLTQKLIKN